MFNVIHGEYLPEVIMFSPLEQVGKSIWRQMQW